MIAPLVASSDPGFSSQYHLANGPYGINVQRAWDDYNGAGIIVGVADNGVQHTHPDLDARYDTSRDYDARDGDSDAAPVNSDDNHGTAVAGVIAGEWGNGLGGVGVAWGSTITGLRMGFGSAGNITQQNAVLQRFVGLPAGEIYPGR